MEKFADKYCEDNPTIFTSADTAYTLAFSIIMLNTDLHSQHIRKRMTKEEFIKNCRGIPSSNTLSDDFFSLVYEDIKENELNVNPPSSLTSSWSKEKVQDEEQRKELFKKETEEIQKTMHSKMLLRSSQASSQTNSNTLNVWKTSLVPEYVKLIFQQCATPVLQVLIQATTTLPSSVTTLSTSLTITTTTTSLFSTTSSNNSSSSNPSTSSSVSSFQVPFLPLHHAILLATHFQLLPELHEHMDVLVTWACTPRSLSSPHPLPALSTSSSVNPSLTLSPASTMHPEAIQWVWRLATMYGAAWDGPTWHSVLQCFSTFEHWNESQTPFEPEVHKHLDCLFVSTAQFPAHVLVCFLQGLCGVSENEQHRPFALKKLVQVACYNINRIRYEFNLIFPLILTHFQDIVLKYPDQDIAAFAVDSLRQLTSKFLDRGDELTHFHSQHEFMHPFLVMMKVSSMQELILTSVQQLIQSRAKHIKSGWKIIFDVLLVGHVNHSLLTESMLFLIHVNVQELLHGHVMIEFIQCLADIGDRSENIALLDLFSQFPLRYKSTTLLGLQKIVLVHAQFDMRRRALEILFQVLDLPYDASEVEETSVSTLDPPPLDAQEEWNLVIFPLFTHNDRLDMIWVQVLQWVLKFFFKRVHATPTTPNWTVGCVPTNNPHQFSDSQLSSTLSLPSTNEIPRTSPVFYRQETEVLVSPDVMTSPLSPSIALPLEHQTVEARIIEKNGVSSSLLNFLSPSWISLYLKGICEVVGLSVTQPHESIAQCAVACYQDLLTWMLTHGTHHDDTVCSIYE
ncbi:Brefeldin A-inhibited guanine nucleotide-exchange protein 2 [Coelomomyces lativittatus]|nr:Brefeldin A-inhibited guanine nucleotide-exchange protein 2 [Coelomomyces lativittatus]